MLYTQRNNLTAPAIAALDAAIAETAKVVLGISGQNNLVMLSGTQIDLYVNRIPVRFDEMDVDQLALRDMMRARFTLSGISTFHF